MVRPSSDAQAVRRRRFYRRVSILLAERRRLATSFQIAPTRLRGSVFHRTIIIISALFLLVLVRPSSSSVLTALKTPSSWPGSKNSSAGPNVFRDGSLSTTKLHRRRLLMAFKRLTRRGSLINGARGSCCRIFAYCRVDSRGTCDLFQIPRRLLLKVDN